ncbi:MAG: hypothetical protein Q8J59_01725 [Methylotenera sp.]|nr:hypothetical protein [Methylotenera sp.]MDO9389442.1 hypothetical protein [Methylotenera sp.]MDP2102949.1 hypothetical protein [Methylotenera sp.]MDP2280389.1 hypothetical protein [Methylotenera sp.]MDP3059849.1 hypothetical protein [Methylotenera sp.]
MKNNKAQDNVTNNQASCLRILLSKNESGQIIFCENCKVAELELGAISLRIDAGTLNTLRELLADASTRLTLYQQEKAIHAQQSVMNCSVH